jgi:serine/threonine-protein kinase RsbW
MSPTPALIATIRAVATDLGERAGFDWTATTDLRMAVDEACSTLIGLAHATAQISGVFTLTRDHIHVRLSTRPATRDTVIDTQGFGWRILSALVDELHTGATASTEESADHLVISLSKSSP